MDIDPSATRLVARPRSPQGRRVRAPRAERASTIERRERAADPPGMATARERTPARIDAESGPRAPAIVTHVGALGGATS
jgi:hypothetical protein